MCEYHVPETVGCSAAYILLMATVSEMSSRANSCIVNIKLSHNPMSTDDSTKKKNANAMTYKYTRNTCWVSPPGRAEFVLSSLEYTEARESAVETSARW